MQKAKQSTDRLSMRNACALIVVIHISNTIVLGFPTGVETDSWLAYLLSAFAVVPLMLVYARMVHLMPGKDLFGMLDFVFGRAATVVISVLLAFFFLNLAAVVRNYYAEFVHLFSLIATPQSVILFSFFAVCVYLAKSGTETMGKWSFIMLVMTLLITVVLGLLSAPNYDFRNLMPMFSYRPGEYVTAALQFVPLPIGEAVILLCMADGFERKASPYKTFVWSSLFSIAFFAVMFVRNCAVLGEKMMDTANYTSHKAASVIHVGSLGTRIEALIAIVFILTGITKVAASLYSGAKAVRHVFRLPDHNTLVLSTGFFTVALSVIVFYNSVEMFDFVSIYRIFVTPFQILLPIVIWIVAEIKTRAKKIPIVSSWKQYAEEN